MDEKELNKVIIYSNEMTKNLNDQTALVLNALAPVLTDLACQQTRIADALERYWTEEDAERERMKQIDKYLDKAIENLGPTKQQAAAPVAKDDGTTENHKSNIGDKPC